MELLIKRDALISEALD